MYKNILILSSILFLSFSASCKQSNDANKAAEVEAQKTISPVQTESQNGMKKAYFASGCFWCVEAVYESVIGVKEAHSGYSGGKAQNPSYNNHADHAESVEVIYDPKVVSFATLVDVYFGSQNVTQINGQGPDRGASYRSIVFYQNEAEKKIIDEKILALNEKLDDEKVAAQVMPFQKFWMAEDYHQNYEKNHPENSYIQNVSVPRINKFQKEFPDLLKKK